MCIAKSEFKSQHHQHLVNKVERLYGNRAGLRACSIIFGPENGIMFVLIVERTSFMKDLAPIYERRRIPLRQLAYNDGQIYGIPRNPRTISKDRFEWLVKSIERDPEFLEIREPFGIEHDGKIVLLGGNMRLRASRKLKLKDMPVKVVSPAVPIPKLLEWIIKDNREAGEDDMDLIANEWSEMPLEDWGFEFPAGVEAIDLDDIVEDEAPELDEEGVVSVRGEVYQLGRHRLMCGDSTSTDDVEILVGGGVE